MISCYHWNSTQGRTDEEWKTQFAWMVGIHQGNWLADLNAWRTARDAGTTLKNFQKTHSGFEPYRGGRDGFTSGPVGDDLQSHHTPSKSAYMLVNVKIGPAIQMENDDHKESKSYFNNNGAPAYISSQKDLIDTGKYFEAIKLDLVDIPRAAKKIAGDASRYDYAISEMLDSIYTVKEWRGPLLK